MKSRVAYIDYDSRVRKQVAEELRKRGLDVAYGRDLGGFISEHGNLGLFPVLLYHPGIHEQPLIMKIIEIYPNTIVSIVTKLPQDYSFFDLDIPVLSCRHYDEITRFVKEHQKGKT